MSDAARAGYYAKVAGECKTLASSDVGLAKAGLTQGEIQSLRAHEQREQARQRIRELEARVLGQEEGGTPDNETAGTAAA